MRTSLERVALQAMKLPVRSRAELADRLVESLDGDTLGDIDRRWATAAKRRRDEVRSGRVKSIPGDEARRRVRGVLKR